MSKKKKLLLIVVAVLIIGGGAFAFLNKMVNDGVQEMPSESQGAEASDFVGQSGSCTPVDEHQWYRSDNTLTINPDNPQQLNIFLEKRGFFQSQDAGGSWAWKSKGIKGFKAPDVERPCYLEFRTSVVDPTNPKRILLGALGDMDGVDTSLNQAGGMLETLDGGETWHQLLKPGMNAYVHDIALDPSDPQTIYYTTSTQKPQNRDKTLLTKGIVYKTTDGGKNWTELNTGLKPNTGGQQIHLDPQNPKRLAVSSLTFSFDAQGRRQPTNDVLGWLTSEDGGTTWKSSHPLPQGHEGIIESYNAPTNFNNFYVSIMTDGGVASYYSLDAGKTFKKSAMPMDIVAYDPNVASGKEAFGIAWQLNSTKLWHTIDAGATWHVVGTMPTELTNMQDKKMGLSRIVVDPTNSKIVYLAGAGANVWKTTDQGKTWTNVLNLSTLP